jgi:hypothetical protein
MISTMNDKTEDEVAHGQQKKRVNGYEYDPDDPEDEVYEDDTFFDDQGRFDLSKVLPNRDDDPVEYIYTRDSTGRVVHVESCLKVPRVQQTDGNDKNENNDHKQEIDDRKEQKEHSNNGGEGNDARNTV